MGAEAYTYLVDYDVDLSHTLNCLRDKVFEEANFHYFGEKPKSIDEALMNADESGTSSILDIEMISDSPEIGCLSLLKESEYERLFGTKTPTEQAVSESNEFFEMIERCQAIAVVVFNSGKPDKYFIAGYSAD